MSKATQEAVGRMKKKFWYVPKNDKEARAVSSFDIVHLEAFLVKELEQQKKKIIKLVEESCYYRTRPTVNLDDETKNCKVCGYDHAYKNKWNEDIYILEHQVKELSAAYERGVKAGEKGLASNIRRWAKLTQPFYYNLTNLDVNPPIETKEKTVDKKGLLFVIKNYLSHPERTK